MYTLTKCLKLISRSLTWNVYNMLMLYSSQRDILGGIFLMVNRLVKNGNLSIFVKAGIRLVKSVHVIVQSLIYLMKPIKIIIY